MGDIFDEKEDLKSPQSLAHKIREVCNDTLRPVEQQRVHNMDRGTYLRSLVDPDVARRRKALAMGWPGDDLVQQIISDALKIMVEYDIKPKEVIK